VRFLTAPDFANKLPNLFFYLHVAFLVHTYLILYQKLSEKSNSKKQEVFLMDLIKVMKAFSTQPDCIEYLEQLRWKESPECLHCESLNVRRRNEHEIGRVGRWNCHDCRATFKVTHGTIFHGTKIPLQKWFLAIVLKKSKSKTTYCVIFYLFTITYLRIYIQEKSR